MELTRARALAEVHGASGRSGGSRTGFPHSAAAQSPSFSFPLLQPPELLTASRHDCFGVLCWDLFCFLKSFQANRQTPRTAALTVERGQCIIAVCCPSWRPRALLRKTCRTSPVRPPSLPTATSPPARDLGAASPPGSGHSKRVREIKREHEEMGSKSLFPPARGVPGGQSRPGSAVGPEGPCRHRRRWADG